MGLLILSWPVTMDISCPEEAVRRDAGIVDDTDGFCVSLLLGDVMAHDS